MEQIKQKKLLIFGGMFSPPHKGHELLLEQAIKTINPDLTLVVPSSNAPHRSKSEVLYLDRFNMCKTFSIGKNNVVVSNIENPKRKGKNFSTRTLATIKNRYKNFELFLLVGGDELINFYRWHRHTRVLSQAAIVAAARKDNREEVEQASKELVKKGGKVIIIEYKPLEISSTIIRERIKNNRTLDELLSDYVMNYIERLKLYR